MERRPFLVHCAVLWGWSSDCAADHGGGVLYCEKKQEVIRGVGRMGVCWHWIARDVFFFDFTGAF